MIYFLTSEPQEFEAFNCSRDVNVGLNISLTEYTLTPHSHPPFLFFFASVIAISRQAWSMPGCSSTCPWGDLEFKHVNLSFTASPWYLLHCQIFIDTESCCWAKSRQQVFHSVMWLELDTLKTQINMISGFGRSDFLIIVLVDLLYAHCTSCYICFSYKDNLLKWVRFDRIQSWAAG